MKKPTELLGISTDLLSELYMISPLVFSRVKNLLEPELFIDNCVGVHTCILQQQTSELFLSFEDFKILKRTLDTNIINQNMSRNYPNNIKPP